MKASFVATALLALGAAAAPLEKRNNGGGNNNGGGDGISDVAILQYALTLEVSCDIPITFHKVDFG